METQEIALDMRVEANGNLTLLANEATRLYLTEMDDDTDHSQQIYELFEPYSTNGSYTLFNAGDANPAVGLTSAPCIAEAMGETDNGRRSVEGQVWWFPDYAVRSFVRELRTKGEVTFTLAPEDDS